MITQEGNSPTVRADLATSNIPGVGYLHQPIVKSHSHASALSPHPKTLGRVEKEIPSPTLSYCEGCGCVCRRMLCSNAIKSSAETQTLNHYAASNNRPVADPSLPRPQPFLFLPSRPAPPPLRARAASNRSPPPGPLTLIISHPLPRVLKPLALEGRQGI